MGGGLAALCCFRFFLESHEKGLSRILVSAIFSCLYILFLISMTKMVGRAE